MANTANPYRRIGANSWQELLDQVNDKLQNPKAGCDPIDEIEAPEESHLWAKEDIQEVHDKLNEMPGDCFEFEDIPDLWKISIIEDIEDQLEEAWCDCEVCCYPCPNTGDTSIHFIVTETVFTDDCIAGCSPNSDVLQECANLREAFYFPAVSNYTNGFLKFVNGTRETNCLENELEKLEEELEKLQDQLAELEEQLAQCPPGDAGVACREAIQAAIDDKQLEIDDKQIEIDEKQVEVDAAIEKRDAGFDQYEGTCQLVNDAVDMLGLCGQTPIRDIVDSFNFPIPPSVFEKPLLDSGDNGPAGPRPCACPHDTCQTSYFIERRFYKTQRFTCQGSPLSPPPPPGRFRVESFGVFDIDGTPCHIGDGSTSCTATHLETYCYSLNCLNGPCGVDGPPCGPAGDDLNVDWQIRIRPPQGIQSPQTPAGEPCET